MQRISASYHVNNINQLKAQMLNWANRFGICCYMDSHDYNDKYHKYDCLVAVDVYTSISARSGILLQLEEFYAKHNDWIFGHLGYDLKNEIEDLRSTHTNRADFPDA